LQLLGIIWVSKNKETKSISNILCNTKEPATQHFRLGEQLFRCVIPYRTPKFISKHADVGGITLMKFMQCLPSKLMMGNHWLE
jgi:hypothetical protein